MRYLLGIVVLAALTGVVSQPVRGDDDSTQPQDRNALFGPIDPRSQYGNTSFPEPLRAEEGDLEREFRVDWFHGEGPGQTQDALGSELEYSFGSLTVEAEGMYERDAAGEFDTGSGTTVRDVEQGFDNVSLASRYPLFNWVSKDGLFDDTVVFGMEVAVPTLSPMSQDTELVPQAWNMLRYNKDWTLQARVGYSQLIGPGDDGGLATLEYSLTLGYSLDLDLGKFPIDQVTPLVEVLGFNPFNHDGRGVNDLSGTAGCQFSFKTMDTFTPKLSVGYAFPLNSAGRDDFHWGISTSLIFDL